MTTRPIAPAPRPVALVGATASGKSAVAMAVASRRGRTELVCIDSMTVYRGMDIGTAKPSSGDRAAVPHHLLDLVDPGEEFTVANFQSAARTALDAIAGRSNRALLVGGTGLYLRAVVDDLELPGRYPQVAAALEEEADGPEGLERLYARLGALDPLAASRTTATNRRRIVRALEVTIGAGRKFSSFGPGLAAYPPSRVALVGLSFDADEVDRRIEARFRRWTDTGLLDEVRGLVSRPGGLSRTARQALGYKELLAHVVDGAPLEACVEAAIRRTRTFARRQMSWFRRDPRIRWTSSQEEAVAAGEEQLDGRGAGARLYGMPHAPAPATEPSQPASPGGTLALSKHEAAGNDFLVLVGTGETAPPSSALVRAVCDRRRGVGADGLLVVRPWEGDADLDMVLYNADGSRAEMSGNGIRCLVHAAVMAGLARTGPVRVRTDAGVRLVEYSADGTLARASVDMGVVTLGDEVEPPVPGAHARRADVGNPHVVVLLAAATDESATTGLESLDLRTLAGKVTAMVGEPMNVEVVVPVGERALALRVFERGVGETAACGTGSCAAAAVAHELGLVDRVVTVESPGGALTVRLGEAPGTPAVLSGPVRHVADVVVWPGALELAGRA